MKTKSAMTYRSIHIPIKKLDKRAKLPAPAHEGDVGFDVYPLETVTLPAGQVTVIRTGLALTDFPNLVTEENKVKAVAFAKIEARSGLAAKHGIFPIGGIIDPSYRGEIMAIMLNSGTVNVTLDASHAIAQFVIYLTLSHVDKLHVVRFLEDDTEATKTDRGTSGLGSTDCPNL